MQANPFEFDKSNPRLVTNKQTSSMVYGAAGLLFLFSVSMYNKRFFRIDQNAANMLAFTIASAPASFVYANFLFNDSETEAAVMNNAREL